MERGPANVEQVVAAQRRRRRLRFWAGFGAIALIGGLWAGLSKDPLGPGIFGNDRGFVDQPAAEVVEFDDFDVPATTVGPAELDDPVTSESEQPPATTTTTAP